jgi:hypothetical protein
VVPLYKNRAPIQVIAPVPPHMQVAHCARADGGYRLVAWLTGIRGASDPRRRSVQRRLQPSRARVAVVLRPAHLALGEIGQDRAGARQALAIDMARRVPQSSSARSPWRTDSRCDRPKRRSPCAAPCRR